MNGNAKTRILFVDDEAMILEVLRMMLEGMKEQWEMAFAASGEQALALMAQRPFDIVVSDMRMPHMTGAQLLNQVMQRYPATVRIILSGYADQELVLKCVGTTHQFLSKPFDLAVLQATLGRIHDLKERLRSKEIRQLVATKDCLPSIPAVYFRIVEALQNADCPVHRIGEIVATDPGLTTKLLQLVNSAFFGFAREVSSADEAVMLLGVGTIRALTLTVHLFSAFHAAPSGDNSVMEVWGHSLRVGRLAKRIAQLEDAPEKLVEEAFTAGLLHDVGKLMLADNPAAKYPELLANARQSRRLLADLERETYHATHAEVGAYLLDLWGLPAPLVEALAYHHEPARAREPLFSPLTAVHVANVLEHEANGSEPGPHEPPDAAYLRQLNLEHRLPLWRNDLRLAQ